MSDRERTRALKLRAQAGVERVFTRRYRAALDAMANAVAKAYVTAGQGEALRTVGDAMLPLRGVLIDNYMRAAKVFRPLVQAEFDAVGKDSGVEFEQAMLAFTGQQTAARLGYMTASTRDKVAAAIHAGVKEGETPEQIAGRLRAVLGGNASRERAYTIAITETHTAAGYASEVTARQTGVEYDREWLSTEDARTRPDHSAADGQVVGAKEPFRVGGEALEYPGDPAGSAKQTVRCRCSVLYHPKGARRRTPGRTPAKPTAQTKSVGVTPELIMENHGVVVHAELVDDMLRAKKERALFMDYVDPAPDATIVEAESWEQFFTTLGIEPLA